MPDSIADAFMNRVSAGLTRRTITSCSKWAEQCRVMGKPFPGKWTFDHHPWLKEMHNADTMFVWGQKAAQMGYTETVLNKVFYEVDVNGVSCLYILPAKTPDASDFSSARFDPAIELSPYLQGLFTETKNIGHKRAGAVNIYIRGSRSRAGLKSVPVGLVVLDELEEMTQEHIPLVFERLSGQLEKQVWGISTPMIDGEGINKYFLTSTMEHFFFPCPHCGKATELVYPECLVVDEKNVKRTHIICKECNTPLAHEDKIEYLNKGYWVAENTDRDSRGFYINQMYSMTMRPWELGVAYIESLSSAAAEQEFYNSKLGLPHIVDGARITDANIEQCIGTYANESTPISGRIITMGIDVGTWLNYEVDEWNFPAHMITSDLNIEAKARVIAFGKVRNFEELDTIMKQYQVQYCVIDAQPERRKSFEFAQRFDGYVKICFYGAAIQGKSISEGQEEEQSITVDRTSWMDVALARFRTRTIMLPMDTDIEYKNQIKAPVRVYVKNQFGQPVAKYVEGSKADHYSHSRVYNELALQFAAGMTQNQDITEPV